MNLRDTHRGPQIGRLDQDRIRQSARMTADKLIDTFLEDRPEVTDWKSSLAKQAFHHIFVHPDGGTQHTGADVRHIRKVEKALNRSVFAVGAMKDRENNVEIAAFARLGAYGGWVAFGKGRLDRFFRR